MRQLNFEWQGHRLEGFYERIGSRLWFHLNGKTWQVEIEAPRRKRGGSEKLESGAQIAAPMPGKINKIEVKAGQTVQANQILVVMEAMKMEYTLKAKVEGRVVKVSCKSGDQVLLGQVLVELEPGESKS